MADTNVKKFLDQGGVSTLWSRIEEELKTKAASSALDTIKQTADAAKSAADTNTAAIAVLNGDVNTNGSVVKTATTVAAEEVAKIVANADASYDTLKEIADWILNDTTGAASMANDITALEALVGDTAVATQISNAITAALKVDGEGGAKVDKYALASELNTLAGKVTTLENAGYQTAAQVGSAIDSKITALNLAGTYEAKGAAATAETNAKGYADGLFANVQALTTAEIDAAIAAATTPQA